MAKINISNLSKCAGGGHISLSLLINDTITKTISFETDDFFNAITGTEKNIFKAIRELISKYDYAIIALLVIIRHNLQTAGYTKLTPPATLKAAIEAETYYI